MGVDRSRSRQRAGGRSRCAGSGAPRGSRRDRRSASARRRTASDGTAAPVRAARIDSPSSASVWRSTLDEQRDRPAARGRFPRRRVDGHQARDRHALPGFPAVERVGVVGHQECQLGVAVRRTRASPAPKTRAAARARDGAARRRTGSAALALASSSTRVVAPALGSPSRRSGRSRPSGPIRPTAKGITNGCLSAWPGVGGQLCDNVSS